LLKPCLQTVTGFLVEHNEAEDCWGKCKLNPDVATEITAMARVGWEPEGNADWKQTTGVSLFF
jgi:hypothetical protein